MAKESPWMDWLSFIFSGGIVLVVTGWMLQQGAISTSLPATWYLIRSTGITAYILMVLSVLWGLAVSSRVVKDWSPGALSMLLHSSISWLAVGFALAHAGLLLLDDYLTYHITDLFIPFIGPYKPFAVGLGILAFWVGLLVSLSFRFKKQLGHRTWKSLHLTSYAAFGLVTLHGLFAGADAHNTGFRLLVGLGTASVISLLVYRVGNK